MHVCRKLCINFKVSGFLISNHLLCVSRASSKESKRTSLVPDWSQWCISCQECSIQVSRKLCINFEVSSFIRSTPSPRYLPYSKILYSYWLIHGQHWPLIGPTFMVSKMIFLESDLSWGRCQPLLGCKNHFLFW